MKRQALLQLEVEYNLLATAHYNRFLIM